MSRPKPRVLIEHIDPNTHTIEQILEADAIWAVVYKNEPFNLRSTTKQTGSKYKKSSFSNPGHAHNLSNRLNTIFNCNDFSVIKMTKGIIVR
jgi:hypothetical protein